jgi:hypothetical protein
MYKRRTLEKRLRALESQHRFEPDIITLTDGSQRKIFGSSDYRLSLLSAALGAGGLTPAQVADLDLIRRAVTIRGPSEGLFELARAIADSPDE